MGRLEAEMVEQFADTANKAIQLQWLVGRRDLRAAVAAKVEPYDPIISTEMRDPAEIAPCAAHCRVQQQQSRGALPGIGEVVDIVGEDQPVAGGEAFHDFSQFWRSTPIRSAGRRPARPAQDGSARALPIDRKSTRLNSSH